MIVKIISLKKSKERRKHIHQQFSKLKLPYNFEDAIDPSFCLKKIFNLFSKKNFEFRYGRSPHLREICFSLSHYTALKKFLNMKNKKILTILEDDAQIMCTKEELYSVSKVFKKSTFDILILGFSKCNDEYEKHINIINPILPIFKIKNKISIGPRYLHTTSGTVGYMVKHKSAKIMCNILPISIVFDDWNYFSNLRLKIAYTNPMVIRENFTKFPSTLNHINYSLKFKGSNYSIVRFLLFSRKYIYGFYRLILLFLKNKFK